VRSDAFSVSPPRAARPFAYAQRALSYGSTSEGLLNRAGRLVPRRFEAALDPGGWMITGLEKLGPAGKVVRIPRERQASKPLIA
jgi:hypothetical protein